MTKLVCLSCRKGLSGKQVKYCSRTCKNRYSNKLRQSYLAQQRRGKRRKLLLIEVKGGKCLRCGYARNHAALDFHHIDPESKVFALDLRALSNRKWEKVLEEVEKCVLLCSNCHAEEHHPDCALNK